MKIKSTKKQNYRINPWILKQLERSREKKSIENVFPICDVSENLDSQMFRHSRAAFNKLSNILIPSPSETTLMPLECKWSNRKKETNFATSWGSIFNIIRFLCLVCVYHFINMSNKNHLSGLWHGWCASKTLINLICYFIKADKAERRRCDIAFGLRKRVQTKNMA